MAILVLSQSLNAYDSLRSKKVIGNIKHIFKPFYNGKQLHFTVIFVKVLQQYKYKDGALKVLACAKSSTKANKNQRPEPQQLQQPQSLQLFTPPNSSLACQGRHFCLREPENLYPKKCYKTTLKRVSQFCHFRDTLFNQKSPFHAVLGLERWHKQTDGYCDLQAEQAQRLIQ